MKTGPTPDNKAIAFLLSAILILSAILRLIHPFEIPFMYDEMSALLRTHYHSFSEEIARGILIDAHPAGVQLFYFIGQSFLGILKL